MVTISTIVSTSVRDFVDYALWIVGIMIAYYCVKFFLAEPPTEAEKTARERRSQEWWDEFTTKRKKKVEAAKTMKKEKKKKVLSGAVQQHLAKALDALQKLRSHLSGDERIDAQDQAEELLEQVKKAWREVHHLQRRYEGEERQKLKKIFDELGVLEEKVHKDVRKKIPKNVLKATDTDWNNAVAAINPELRNIATGLGLAWDGLEKFYGK